MYTLNCVDSFCIVSPAETYVYDIIPAAGVLAAISSDNILRLLNPLNLSGTPLSSIPKVNLEVTCLKALGNGDSSTICTAGRDGKMRLTDTRNGVHIGEARSGECITQHCSTQIPDMIKHSSPLLMLFRTAGCFRRLFAAWSAKTVPFYPFPLIYTKRELNTDQNAAILSLACSSPYGIAAGTELTNHQATVSLWCVCRPPP